MSRALQIHLIGKRVDVVRDPIRPRGANDKPLVVVPAAANLVDNGTAFVRAAAQELGWQIEYLVVRGGRQPSTAVAIERTDLVVDQLATVSLGVLTIEAMSMAKPVACYLLPECLPELPDDYPLIRADPLTITDMPSSWIGGGPDLHEVGLASREYVERNHHVSVVARPLLDVYAQLPAR